MGKTWLSSDGEFRDGSQALVTSDGEPIGIRTYWFGDKQFYFCAHGRVMGGVSWGRRVKDAPETGCVSGHHGAVRANEPGAISHQPPPPPLAPPGTPPQGPHSHSDPLPLKA